MSFARRVVHYGPGPTDLKSVISDRVIAGCWFELHRQGGCGAGELRLWDEFPDRNTVEIGDWISLEYSAGNRWYFGRVEERAAKSPAEVSLRLQGMGVELGEVFPGGFSPNRADGVPPHRYARTDLFPNDPDYSLETVDAVSQPHEFVELLVQQYVVPRTDITYDASLIESPGDTEGITSAKFRGEESVRSIIKEQAVRAFNASWGVDGAGKFFFLRKRNTVLATFREGREISVLEESRDRELLYNRVMLTGGYVYDERIGSDIAMRGFYRWRGNYIQPASRDQHGERRIRIWIPWIRTQTDSRQFVKEFFRVYAQPTSRYLVEVADRSSLVVPWGGRIRIEDRNGAELITAMIETIRVQFDHAPKFRLEIGPEDPHTHWPEPPHDERWEIPGVDNQGGGGGGGSELSFSSGDVGPSDISSSSLGPSSSAAPSSGAPSSGAPSSGAPSSGAPSSGAPSSGAPSSGAPSSGAPSSGAPSSGAPSSGAPSSSASASSSGAASSSSAPSSSVTPTCVSKTNTTAVNFNDGGAEPWTISGIGGGATILEPNDSQRLVLSGFGFSIPGGASITGIEVTVRRQDNFEAANDMEVDLANGGTSRGSKSDTTFWPMSYTDKVMGSTTDTWGGGVSVANINATDFEVWVYGVHSSNGDEAAADVASVTVKVCYV